MHSRTLHFTELGVFTALAFILSYIESLFPLPIPFPGIKAGFANLVILVLLYRSGFRDALAVSLVRNVLNALTFGSLFGLFYSLAGSILSLFIMEGLRRIKKPSLSLLSISCAGGIFHNIGQIIIASLLVGREAILHYFPLLYFSGMAAGILIGILAGICLHTLPVKKT